MMKKDLTTCHICKSHINQRSFPPMLLKPAYFFLLWCYPTENIFSLRFFEELFLNFWKFKSIKNTPICRSCCNTLIFASIAIYVLLLSIMVSYFLRSISGNEATPVLAGLENPGSFVKFTPQTRNTARRCDTKCPAPLRQSTAHRWANGPK